MIRFSVVPPSKHSYCEELVRTAEVCEPVRSGKSHFCYYRNEPLAVGSSHLPTPLAFQLTIAVQIYGYHNSVSAEADCTGHTGLSCNAR